YGACMTTPGAGPLALGFGLTVTPENVLGVRAVVMQEATDLQNMLRREERNAILPRLGGDPVSGDMSAAFNVVTHGLFARAREHIDSLFALGEELAATARSYGETEDEVAASFARTEVSKVPTPLRQLAGLSAAASRPMPTTLGQLFGGLQ
ncbi:MAG TPA: hypothetical protein VIQ30_11385, partial [Pseudonocardia sp.]